MRTSTLRPRLPQVFAACAVLAPAALPASLPAAALHVLEPLGIDSFDYALGIASDGGVVGYSDNFETLAPVLWTKTGSAYGAAAVLPLVSGGENGEARWISPDAAHIAGRVSLPGADEWPDYQAVLWTRGAGGAYSVAALPRLGSGASEGLVLAGTAGAARLVGQDGATPSAALWQRSGDGYTVRALPAPASAAGPSLAAAISADGTRVAGHVTVNGDARAALWTETNGSFAHLALQSLPGGGESRALALSADGSVAVGASGFTPVRWDAATGLATALEMLPGDEAAVHAISADGHWLGGASLDSDTLESAAVLWDHAGQIHDLVALADGAGLAFGDFNPESVTGVHLVSTGRYTIVGTGVFSETGYTQGFVLENLALATPIPEPDTAALIVGAAAATGVYMSRRRRIVAPATSEGAATWTEAATLQRTLGSSARRSR